MPMAPAGGWTRLWGGGRCMPDVLRSRDLEPQHANHGTMASRSSLFVTPQRYPEA